VSSARIRPPPGLIHITNEFLEQRLRTAILPWSCIERQQLNAQGNRSELWVSTLNQPWLDSGGLGWTRLDLAGLGLTQLDSAGLGWIRLDSAGLGWAGWAGLGKAGWAALAAWAALQKHDLVCEKVS